MRYLGTVDRFAQDSPGGAYRIAWELARLVARQGHKAALLCGAREDEPTPTVEEVDGVRVVRYRFPELPRLHPARWHRHREAVARAFATHLAEPWDVLHAHSPAGALALFSRLASSRRLYSVNSPIVLEQKLNWAGKGLEGLVKRWLGLPYLARQERLLLKVADAIHVLSRFTANELGRLYGDSLLSKVSEIPWWSDRAYADEGRAVSRSRLGWPASATVLFSLRRLVPRMGLGTLLEAIALLPKELDVFAVIGGDGPERQNLMTEASRLGLSKRVCFCGRMSEPDVSAAYTAADLFVLPSQALECFGIIAVEALGAGCPVIGSRVGAIPEVVEPILPGWSFEAGNPSELAGRIERFISGDLVSPGRLALQAYARSKYGHKLLASRYLSWIAGDGN